ncbi:MAG: tRNA/rRNA methyltransferase [Bacteroidales bacterium]|nr:tRNA/rRNA methyltransferase [Bacteroidales bacterium]
MEIIFILVEPKVPENIGASARAMHTMGFSKLRLVNPQDHMQEKARRLAHGSVEVLENARVFASLEEATKDIDFLVATSAKNRSINTQVYPVHLLKKIFKKKKNSVSSVAFVFGREESGLTNEEISLCDMVSYVPMQTQYPSLNLSQAVMIYAHQLFINELSIETGKEQNGEEKSYKELKQKVITILNDLQVADNPALYGRLMEKLAAMDDDNVHLLHSLIKYYLRRKA